MAFLAGMFFGLILGVIAGATGNYIWHLNNMEE